MQIVHPEDNLHLIRRINKIMKRYTVEEFRKYLDSQESRGDIYYYLNEDNIEKANAKEETEFDDEEFRDLYT